MEEEQKKGNYVIAGETSTRPSPTWTSENIRAVRIFGHRARLTQRISARTGTPDGQQQSDLRSLDKVYKNADKKDCYYYMLDGFILSKNLQVDSIKTENLNFKNSDHNPVILKATLN